ncbi:hypothetical protein AAFF_G00420760 [Aldrovandia affinis]|uniref:Uncharacterized protein n=1 Tax=Aldrovandia affinis TaxID=143900 RepID=A0AAD7WIY7_9TELE|nr:hypothetical protein AAFF_G00420760 [Aldrovandia affinis]
MTLAECRPLDARCRRRRLRAAAMKLPCSFWFLLLFGAGGLVLFIHLQDLSEMVQQQGPGGFRLSLESELFPLEGQFIGARLVIKASNEQHRENMTPLPALSKING